VSPCCADLSGKFADTEGRARDRVGGVRLPGRARFDDVDERVEFGDHGVSLRSTMFPSPTRPPLDNLCPIRSVTRRAGSQERVRALEPPRMHSPGARLGTWSMPKRVLSAPRAANQPFIPWTPGAGGVAAEHRNAPGTPRL